MYQLFESLSHAVEGSPFIAVSASFIWGVLSILLSPCHLVSIPLIIGFISNQGKITTKTAFYLSGIFAFGILLTIALIGLITAGLGKMIGNIGRSGNYIVAAVFIIIGLYLLEIINIPFLSASSKPGMKKKGMFAAFVLGFIFGIALGPCTFAYMAPMLAVVFKLASTKFLYSAGLLGAYAIGHCSVIVFAGTSIESVQKYLNWGEKSKGISTIKKICGALLIICAIYLIITTR
ncbi:MAG TPA: cytochrome c biogenesis protein CcdA [bacterium]|mgnify:CR=1 FL=1|nr:cytochrome c biogenesis protein CcdA [bacterium]HOL35254.1 cytochrome c biogenesis protein CcdA [bacterium]HPP08713.1 cytochrome c biogenesis protein CcdA [bacterium]